MFDCVDCGFEFDESLESCPDCDTTSGKKRPKLIAVSAITAEFILPSGSSIFESNIGELWPLSDDICYRLITEVERKFKRKNKYHSYYEEEPDPKSTPSRLQRFNKGELSFKELVGLFMGDLVDAATEAGAYKISGGNIVFMHYKGHETEDLGRLLAIMVDKKDGFDFDEDLVPKGSKHINLEALRQAALFDLTLFDTIYPDPPTSQTYLKFIKGNSQGKFFRSAFGCKIRADNNRSVEQLFHAIMKFQEDNGLSEKFYDNSFNKVSNMLEKAANEKRPIAARVLYEAVESELPEGSSLKGTFANFVNTNEFEINHHIEPTPQSVKSEMWVDVEAFDESFKAKIFRKKIGAYGSGSVVQYDVENNRLILNVYDESTRKALSKLIESNEQ